jgi:hypothetical protein
MTKGKSDTYMKKRKNIDAWVTWIAKDPEYAETLYPETIDKLKENIRSSDPVLTSNIILSVPRCFSVRKEQAEKLIGYKKRLYIKEQIELIDTVLRKDSFSSLVERKAVEIVRNEIVAQRNYWSSLLNKLKIE